MKVLLWILKFLIKVVNKLDYFFYFGILEVHKKRVHAFESIFYK